MNNPVDAVALEAHQKGDAVLLALSGFMKLHNIRETEAAMKRMLECSGERIYLDLHDLEYMDSAGLGHVLRLNSQAKNSEKQLIVLEPNLEISRLFSLSKMHLIVKLIGGVEARQIRMELKSGTRIWPAAENQEPA